MRELVEGIVSGEVDYARLNPQLAGALRKDLPKFQLFLSRLGQPQRYRLTGVAPGGFDEYEITHERGTSRWSLAVDGAGIVTGASVPL